MARTVTDVALLLDAMAEPDARDWSALPPPDGSFLDGLERGVQGVRVAFSADLGHVDVDPEVAELVGRAAAAFGDLGAVVAAAEPGFDDPRETFDALWSAGAAAAMPGLGDPPPEALDPGLAEVVAFGRSQSLLDYLAASRRRDELAIQLSRFFVDWDLLLTPTLPLTAFEAGREVPEGWPDRRWPSWTPFTYPFNLTQQPAASVPCGFTSEGLPVGLQIVGPRHGDAAVLRAARAYEAAHPQPTLASAT
jgi:aspartyl-tRNA(Asn)/glutamyl-tRNA(Gln) amidotransferase subunit A